jgi:hypothetical protein
MLEDASIVELAIAIADQGFFIGEALLVVPFSSLPDEHLKVIEKNSKKIKQKDENERYLVVEGNRRLTAVKLLNNPKIIKDKRYNAKFEEIVKEAVNKPTQVPCIVFNSEKKIMDYLGFRHVTGIKQWNSLAKARYLYSLMNTSMSKNEPFQIKCKRLARIIGSKSPHIRNLLVSYDLYLMAEKNSFFQIKDLKEETIEFSRIVDLATKYSSVTEFLGIDLNEENPLKKLNKNHLKELFIWTYEKENGKTRIGDNRNFAKFSEIVANKNSLKLFREGMSVTDSYQYSFDFHDLFKINLHDTRKKLKELSDLTNKLNEIDESFLTVSEEIEKTAIQLSASLQALKNRESKRKAQK